MTPENARIVLYAITGLASFVWICGLLFVLSSARGGNRSPSSDERWGEEPKEPGSLEGSIEVEGEPADLLASAVSTLVSGGVPGIGAVRIVETQDDGVIFEGLGPTAQGQPALGRGRLRFLPTRTLGMTRVEFAVRPGGRGLLFGAAIVQALGLVAIVGGSILIGTLVVPSERPDVRWQVVQMLQAAHFLWPPFLLGGLYRAQRRSLRRRLEAFASNLAYLGR
jgi:hypothetical protein